MKTVVPKNCKIFRLKFCSVHIPGQTFFSQFGINILIDDFLYKFCCLNKKSVVNKLPRYNMTISFYQNCYNSHLVSRVRKNCSSLPAFICFTWNIFIKSIKSLNDDEKHVMLLLQMKKKKLKQYFSLCREKYKFRIYYIL